MRTFNSLCVYPIHFQNFQTAQLNLVDYYHPPTKLTMWRERNSYERNSLFCQFIYFIPN